MSRDDGFQTADISTVMLDDAKMRKLARHCPNDGDLAAAIVVYMATLLASWREGRRLTAAESESWIEPTPARIGSLQVAGLLDASGKVPSHAWEFHFKPAWERRENSRAAGRKGAARRWGGDSDPIAEPSAGIATPMASDSEPMPNRPTDRPTDLPTDTQSSPRLAIPVKGMNGDVTEVDVREHNSDVLRLQKLAETLTSTPYVMQSVHAGLGAKAVNDLLPHGYSRVEAAWRKIAKQVEAAGPGSHPTLRQLVLGADDILNPVPKADAKEQREDEERAAYDRRVARTQRELDALRATP